MVINLRDSKARLSELVELASSGEDVLITVRGKPKARLTKAGITKAEDPQEWREELLKSQSTYSTEKCAASVESLLDDSREDRF